MDKKEVVLLDSRFQLIRKIGHGSFGNIYLAQDIDTNQKVAVKIEKPRKNETAVDMIAREVAVLSVLGHEQGFPSLLGHGAVGRDSWMAVSLLGPNLSQVSKRGAVWGLGQEVLCGRDGLAVQMVSLLQSMHRQGYLHRDIKPENFLLEKEETCSQGSQSNASLLTGQNSNTAHNNSENMSQPSTHLPILSTQPIICKTPVLFLVDYGLSKRWKENGCHVAYREKKGMVGTARYVSLNTHFGIEQSRRDDLEAVGYLLLYLHKGRLPWQDLKVPDKKEKFKRIKEMKQALDMKAACKDIPGLLEYFIEVRRLDFTDSPDYDLLRRLLGGAAEGKEDILEKEAKEDPRISPRGIQQHKLIRSRTALQRQRQQGDNDEICQESQENSAQRAYQFENHTKYLKF